MEKKKQRTKSLTSRSFARSLIPRLGKREQGGGRRRRRRGMGMDGNGPGDDKAMSKPIDVRSRPPTFRLHRPFAANLSIFFFFLPLDEFYPLDATIFAKFHHQRGGLYLDYIWSAIDICHDRFFRWTRVETWFYCHSISALGIIIITSS